MPGSDKGEDGRDGPEADDNRPSSSGAGRSDISDDEISDGADLAHVTDDDEIDVEKDYSRRA